MGGGDASLEAIHGYGITSEVTVIYSSSRINEDRIIFLFCKSIGGGQCFLNGEWRFVRIRTTKMS